MFLKYFPGFPAFALQGIIQIRPVSPISIRVTARITTTINLQQYQVKYHEPVFRISTCFSRYCGHFFRGMYKSACPSSLHSGNNFFNTPMPTTASPSVPTTTIIPTTLPMVVTTTPAVTPTETIRRKKKDPHIRVLAGFLGARWDKP